MGKAATNREFEVVLFGATGFTGRLVAEHLVRHHVATTAAPLRLALAGRDKAKLERVRGELARSMPEANDVPLLVADSADTQTLAALASRTRVVATSVGPYAKYGLPLVGACAQAGTHYADITGEVPFIHASIQTYDRVARESGACIVHTCGYDSVPSDLGTWFAIQTYRKRFGALPQRVVHGTGEGRGGFSGGTVASLLLVLEGAESSPEVKTLLADPYALTQVTRQATRQGTRQGRTEDQRGVRFDADLGLWTAPFLMAPINTRVVRRSLDLQSQETGTPLDAIDYAECLTTGRGPKGAVFAGVVTGFMGLGEALLSRRGPRQWAESHVLPKPGEGPSEKVRSTGYFVSRFAASGKEGRVHVTVRGEGDPGYSATSRMLGEAAMTLARDALTGPGGVRTPASTMADPLLRRLQTQRIRFDADVMP